jgi:hypothetical protein
VIKAWYMHGMLSRAWRLGFGLALIACSTPAKERDGISQDPAAALPSELGRDAGARATWPPSLPVTPPFPESVRSLELQRSIAVRFAPAPDAKNLGTVAANTRVGWKQAVRAPGCDERWIEIQPRGWVCEIYLRPSPLPATGVELPRLGWDELVPGEYGKVEGKQARTYRFPEARIDSSSDGARAAERPDRRTGGLVVARSLAGAATVRRYGELQFGGKQYWAIGGGEYLPAASIRAHVPSAWSGVRLGDGTGHALPLGFALLVRSPGGNVPTYSEPIGGKKIRALPPRATFSIIEVARDGAGGAIAYRIGDAEWVRAAEARIAELTEPPPHTFPDERWVDIDLDAQVLVAYEGVRPVYATLVTTGARATPTATGIYRIWVKFAETDMNGQMGDEAPYSVATVPWTQFYAKDLALHTAYWHDKFGTPRSHGCVNLSPVDARTLYFWSSPDVPPGWSMAHGVAERPGSLVRVRSAADPNPEFKGYARRVHEERLRAQSP